MSQALLKFKSFYSIYVGCFLQTRYAEIPNVSLWPKDLTDSPILSNFQTLSLAIQSLSHAFEALREKQ